MQEKRKARGVVLPDGHTGSSLLHAVLMEALARYPDALGSAGFPANATLFKRDYGRFLAAFEAARTQAAERAEIARFIVRRTQQALQYVDEDYVERPLFEHLRTPVKPVSLTQGTLPGPSVLAVRVPFEGKLLAGDEVRALAEQLLQSHQLTRAAYDALTWIVEYAARQGGSIDLRGHRFVMLGAGAELAPTELLLNAGATVLWVDLHSPERVLTGLVSGTLVQSRGARNLLEQPREIAAAIARFAAEGPVHVGMYAYAGGETQEWRLAAVMNAIVGSLDPALLRSVSLLVSPTSPGTLTKETLEAAQARLRDAPLWQRTLQKMSLLKQPGYYARGDRAVALATVSQQGLSYQAAQYVSKLAAAEAYAAFGNRTHSDAQRPVTVSANVAGITRTRSLSHPLFQAAFAGAAHFGVRIFEAQTTRALSGLLMLHDLLNPKAPGAAQRPAAGPRERAQRLHTQQVHGGVYALPYVLEGVIRAAALLGAARHPGLLFAKSGGEAPSGDAARPVTQPLGHEAPKEVAKPPANDGPRVSG